jgi:4-hydroxybenzoate polyprenyltransferase
MLRPVILTLEMIKIQHTLFALPFAFLAAFTAAGAMPAGWTIFWIVVAMTGARSAAMAFNRLVDAPIDAKNPRTAGRALPAGLVSRGFVIVFTIASAALLLLAAWQLNPLAFALAPVALLIILGYSFTKRFTSLSHIFLGLALAVAPIGAAIAVEARIDPRMWFLAGAVLTWTAGFDILYSLQDLEFDRSEGLYSIPSRIGASNALVVSRVLHGTTVGLLAAFGLAYGFGPLYWTGLAAGSGLLLWQHSIVAPEDLSRLDAAFFTANGVLAIVLFVFGACDILIRAGGAG